uniref:Uncharacterized protein n=1 Tax=Anopheles culicifacies TaxID=139723 RepID=A0A182MGL6_9DIPT
MQSNATGSPPPIGARRVKTDLHTSEKLYIHSVGRSRSNSPMHAGLVGRHTSVTHRKAASEPKGPVSSAHPLHATTNTTTTYLTVPHNVTTTVLHSPNRQRSSSTGTPSSRVGCSGTAAAAHHHRLLPPSSATIERSASVRLSTSPSRAGDHHSPNGAGIANRSQLPARARLLTRRLQNNATPTNGSESPRSIDSLPRRTFSGSYKTATLSQFHNLANNNCTTDSASTATNSAEDLTLLDKSLRNSMLQDVVHFKKQLVRLRRILQEVRQHATVRASGVTSSPFVKTCACTPASTRCTESRTLFLIHLLFAPPLLPQSLLHHNLAKNCCKLASPIPMCSILVFPSRHNPPSFISECSFPAFIFALATQRLLSPFPDVSSSHLFHSHFSFVLFSFLLIFVFLFLFFICFPYVFFFFFLSFFLHIRLLVVVVLL